MKKAVKERGQKPTPEDYNELISNVDIMLRAFRDLKSEVGSEWYWWSLSIYARGNITKTEERAQSIWLDFREKAMLQESLPLGGCSTFENKNEFTAYFATSKDGTESDFFKIANIAESAVKALLIFYPPKCGFELSRYLDSFVGTRSYYADTMTSPAARHAARCWFEFVYNMAFEIGSPLQSQCYEVPTVEDLPLDYFELTQKPQAENQELRLYPEIRRIEHEICKASILALEFLKTKVKARIQSQPQMPARTIKLKTVHKALIKALSTILLETGNTTGITRDALVRKTNYAVGSGTVNQAYIDLKTWGIITQDGQTFTPNFQDYKQNPPN